MKEDAIVEARMYFNNKWPEQLWTGIMFFQGFRITKQEFEKQVN